MTQTEQFIKQHNLGPLLTLIRKIETGREDGYNVVYGGIRKKDRPPKPLTTMTIKEVLDWQDSIDRYYPSEAAGAYQIMEDTLRVFYQSAGLSSGDLFDKHGQDTMAIRLLYRRHLQKYLQNQMTSVEFANHLAKEWASFPVASGHRKGRSYYGGDGLNKSLVSVERVLDAVRQIRR